MTAVIAIIAIAVYANARFNGFAMDDEGVILKNGLVHNVDGLWRAFAEPYWPRGGGQYRPLVIASFTAGWLLSNGNPLVFHVVNLAWHAAASLLVFSLARRWLSLGGASIAAVLFAVQPVHVEAVANVVGRSELMAAGGVLAMLLLHQRRSPWAAVAFAFALLSKEHAAVAPVLAALGDVLQRPAGRSRETPGVRLRTLYLTYAGVAVAWGGALALVFERTPFAAPNTLWLSMDAPSRWLTVLGVVPTWLRLWFFPFDLSADYSPRVTAAWPDNVAAAAVGAIAIVALALLIIVARRRARPVAFAVGLMAVAMLPVANVLVPTGLVVGERTLYLSSIGAALLAGFVAERLAARQTAAAVALAVAIALAFGARTWTRTPVWQSNRALLTTTLAEHPEASWTHVLVGRVYAGNGGYDKALGEYQEALRLFDRDAVAWNDAVYAATRSNRLELADSLLREARLRGLRDYSLSAARAYVTLELRRYPESVAAARDAITIAPDSATPRLYAAWAFAAMGMRDSAKSQLSRIPRRDAQRRQADSLGRILDSLGGK